MVIHFHEQKVNLKNIMFAEDCFLVANSQTIHIKCEVGREQQLINHLPDWLRNNYKIIRQTGYVIVDLSLGL